MSKSTLPKMNTNVKQAWVEALRSNKYVQGKHRLKSIRDGVTRYCCLGVLGEVKAKLHKKRVDVEDINNGYQLLCKSMLKWSGLNSDAQERLSEFNDNGGKSFKWIASYIDQYL